MFKDLRRMVVIEYLVQRALLTEGVTEEEAEEAINQMTNCELLDIISQALKRGF